MLALELSARSARFSYPTRYYQADAIGAAAGALGVSVEARVHQTEPASSVLEVAAEDGSPEDLLADLFGRLNGYPAFHRVEVGDFRNAAEPLLSCVILLTANDLFVRRQLVPSIIASSRGWPIEIVVVHNGPNLDLAPFERLTVVQSEFGWVARGYNAGVAAARGRYVAIFHDDCLLDDPRWIERALAGLSEQTLALSAEIQTSPFLRTVFTSPEIGDGTRFSEACDLAMAKCVPLVMERERYLELGGFDEYYYVGMEDLDFTQQLLVAGYRVGHLPIGSWHFNGMSTVCLLSRQADLFRQLFACHLVPAAALAELRNGLLGQQAQRRDFRLLYYRDTLHCLRKLGPFFAAQGRAELLRGQRLVDRYLARHFGEYLAEPIVVDRAKLIETYRAMTAPS